MKRAYFILVASFIAVMTSCTYNEWVDFPVEEPTDSVSFSKTVEPIFQSESSGGAGCISCHGESGIKGLNLTTGNAYDNIMNGRVDLDNAENSLIYQKPHPDNSHSKKYDSQQALNVLTWIKEGAHNN